MSIVTMFATILMSQPYSEYYYIDAFNEENNLYLSFKDTVINEVKYISNDRLFDGLWFRMDSIAQYYGYRTKIDTIYTYQEIDGKISLVGNTYQPGEFSLFKYYGLLNEANWAVVIGRKLYKAILRNRRDAVYTPYKFFKNSYSIYYKAENFSDGDLEFWIVPNVGIVRIYSGVVDFRLDSVK